MTRAVACAPFVPFVIVHGPPFAPVTIAVLQLVVRAAWIAAWMVAADALKGMAAVVCVASVSVMVKVPP